MFQSREIIMYWSSEAEPEVQQAMVDVEGMLKIRLCTSVMRNIR